MRVGSGLPSIEDKAKHSQVLRATMTIAGGMKEPRLLRKTAPQGKLSQVDPFFPHSGLSVFEKLIDGLIDR